MRYFIPENRSCYRDIMMVFEDVRGQQRKDVESARAIVLRHPPNYPVWPSGRTTFIHDPRLHMGLQARSSNFHPLGAADIKQLVPATRSSPCPLDDMQRYRTEQPGKQSGAHAPTFTTTTTTRTESAGYVSSHLDFPSLMGMIILHQ